MTETATNEHPIPFSGSMVRAVLEGRKTQMRRVIKPQPINFTGHKYIVPDHAPKAWHDYDGPFTDFCPYGAPGDRLWVRETWRVGGLDVGGYRSPIRVAIDYKASPEIDRTPWVQGATGEWLLRMRDQTLDDANQKGVDQWDHGESPARWRPSIHMPRWASRITLVVKRVWVERVQEISPPDLVAEGVATIHDGCYWGVFHEGERRMQHREAMHELWDSINASKGHGWNTNPWVWCVEFERIEVK